MESAPPVLSPGARTTACPAAPLPKGDAARVAALARYAPDREAEAFSGLARTAALALQAPMALVTFVGEDTLYVGGRAGSDLADLPRELSFCTFGICGEGPLVVEDARRDERFVHHPLVTREPGIRSYAGAPIRTPDGHAIGMVCVFDTAPRTFEAAEVLEALAASVMDALEARRTARLHERVATEYRALFRAHPQPMLAFDEGTLRILSANDAALETYGYTQKELRALTILDLRPESEREAVRELLARSAGAPQKTGPWTHRRRDGAEFPVMVEARPVVLRGRPARLVRIDDVSDAVRTREALGASEALTAAALAALDDIFFVGDGQGRMLRGNRKAFEATGYSEEEFKALAVPDFFEGEDGERALAAFTDAFRTGSARVQADLVAKDGTRTPYEFTGAALYDGRGEPAGVCGIGRDISRWRRDEALRAGKLDVLRAVIEGEPLPATLARIARLLEVQLPEASCSILLYDPPTGTLRHGAAPSLPDAYNVLTDGLPIGPAAGSCGTAAHRNAPVFAEDIETDPLWAGLRDRVRPYGLRACWSTPINGGEGDVLGTVAVYYREPRATSEADVSLVGLVVSLAALAIEHHRQQEELCQRDRLLRAVADSMLALLSEVEVETAVATALRTIGEAAGVDRVYLFEHHREPGTGALLASQRAEWAGDGIEPQIGNPALQGFRQEEMLPEWTALLVRGEAASANVRELPGPVREVMEAQDIRAFLLVPVRVGGETWGFLGFDDCRGEREWTEAQHSMLRVAASALGAAYTRARAEEALRSANARFEAVSANAPGVVFECVIEPDGAISYPYISAGGPATLGVDLTVLEQEPERLSRIVHPEDWLSMRDSIVEAAVSHEPWSWEGRILSDTGEVRWAAGASRLVAAEASGQTRWHGLFLDVTRQKEAEAARRESEERYRTLFDRMGEGFCVIELVYEDGERPTDYRFIEANPAFERHTGLSGALGRRVTALTEHINPLWFELYDRAARSGDIVRAEGESLALGRWFAVEAHRTGGSEERPRVAVLFSDITDRKLYEQRLRDARDVAEEAQRAAEEADRLKTALLTNMSHEFRTPLTGIIGFADLLASELDAEQREMALHVVQNGKRLQETLTSVLALSQLESGVYPLEIGACSLADEVRTVTDRLAPLVEERGLELRCALPPGGCPVRADERALRQVVASLLTNAVKFTDSGWIGVEVRAGEAGAELVVRDTGVGIGAAFLPHLFKEFRQESEGLDRRFEGSGLGLAVAHRLVRAMGGTIEVESERGEGTTFTVRLPPA